MKICEVANCDTLVLWGGFCGAHYKRWTIHGDPLADKPVRRRSPNGCTPREAFEHYMGALPETSECIEWRGTIVTTTGYGSVFVGGRNNLAHRISYELFNGQLSEDTVVRHTCDNRPCVNPRHLLAGTQADNIRDSVERGRHVSTTGGFLPKLDPDKVREIRRLHATGINHTDLAKIYSVNRHTIQSVCVRRTWKNVD